jgi:hypothetical protein
LACDVVKNKGRELSPAVVVAITASLCAMINKPATDFTYKAIRRVYDSHHGWSKAGTTDLISSRQRILGRGY